MKSKWWAPYAFLAVPLAVYVTWVIIPIARTMILSFTSWDGISPSYNFIGLDNYVAVFHDRVFWTSLINNAKWLVGFALVAVPAGLGLAILFNHQLRGASLLKTMIFLPMTLSFVVIGQMWSWILEPRQGVLNMALRAVGLGGLAKPWLSNPALVTYALIGVALWRQISYAMILFLAGLKNVPTPLVEASYVDGAGAWQRFWYVVLPLLRPATIIAITVNIIDSLRAFDIIYVMTRGGPFYSSSVMANYMYIEAFNNYRMGYGSAIAVIQFIITLSFIAVYIIYTFKQEAK